MSFPALHGRRVSLELFRRQDITAGYISWLKDPEVVRFSNQRFRTHDHASCETYLRSFDGTQNLFLSIRLVAEDRAVGTMTVYRNEHHGTADIGIMVGDRAVWGSGIGHEAWQLLVDWLLTEGRARKVTAGMLACNRGMVRLAEKSGMVLEGRRIAHEIVDGQAHDVLHFGKFHQ